MKARELLEFAHAEKQQPLKLVHVKTGKEVEVGDKVKDFRGDPAVVTGWTPPRKPASEGHIRVKINGHEMEYYAGVYDTEWINRTDRG